MNSDIQGIRQKLLEMQRQIAIESGARADDAMEVDLSRVGRLSRMDAMQNQAMAQATEARRQLRLTRVRAALERLEHGEYGICRSCEAAIDPRRLAIDPTATRCIACASHGERQD
jgi:DnaK suppressor protein